MSRVTYHYCTMHQDEIAGSLIYNDGFITVDSFDTSEKGVYFEFKELIAKQIEADKDRLIVLSLSIVGERR